MRSMFAAVTFIIFAGCTHAPVLGPDAERSVASIGHFQKLDEPCRLSSECAPQLNCHANLCRPIQQVENEAGEMCSRNSDCRSMNCAFESHLCQTNSESKFGNGQSCANDFQCRSGSCGPQGTCLSSSRFPGLPGEECRTNNDCLSSNCESEGSTFKCSTGGTSAASCAGVGERVGFAFQCCSGANSLTSDGTCMAVQDSECARFGNCRGRVGKTCADVGDSVVISAQCCSSTSVGHRCVVNFSSPTHPCAKDAACPSGRRCDLNLNLCE